MEKSVKRIQFKDFKTLDEFIYFCIENDINSIIDNDGKKYIFSELDRVWENNKNVFNDKRFK